MLRIDLGCGRNKHPGFTGIDRYPLADVDIVADINHPLPLRDSSVDLLLASHSLEHVSDLIATMQEIYRVCRHGAQVCVVAPYSEQKLNLANPYHMSVFNEHTPRFWTPHETTIIDPEEFETPHARVWGLSESDHSKPGIDFRMVRMEHFYFPEYVGLPAAEQRRLRRERFDVCDQIMYHLIVWKQDQASETSNFDNILSQFLPYQPEEVLARKIHDKEIVLQKREAELAEARSAVARLESELAGGAQLRETAAHQARRIEELNADLQRYREMLHEMRLSQHEQRSSVAAALEQSSQLREKSLEETTRLRRQLLEESNDMHRQLLEARTELTRLKQVQQEADEFRRQVQELQAREDSSSALKAKLTITQAELETANTLLLLQQQKNAGLAASISAARESHTTSIRDSVRKWLNDGTPARSLHGTRVGPFLIARDRGESLPPELAQIREFCNTHFAGAKRASLVRSGDLGAVPYREYEVRMTVPRLSAVTLAVSSVLPDSQGLVGVEIVSSASRVLTQATASLQLPQGQVLTTVVLPTGLSGAELGKPWLLRIFVRNAAGPVTIYELAKGALLGGETQFFPFVSFH